MYQGLDVSKVFAVTGTGILSLPIGCITVLIRFTGSFLPITLEQLAREHGVLRSDGTTSCIETTTNSLHRREKPPCVVRLFGTDINTSSFALYTFSLAALLQVLVLVSISAIADHGEYHWTYLV